MLIVVLGCDSLIKWVEKNNDRNYLFSLAIFISHELHDEFVKMLVKIMFVKHVTVVEIAMHIDKL